MREATNSPGGRDFFVFRVVWVVLAVVVIGLDVWGIPYAFAEFSEVCEAGIEACMERGAITHEGARQLYEAGLSPAFYGAYVGVVIESAFTAMCFVISLLLFLRRSSERMALFTSFALLIFGGAGAAGTMHSLPETFPALWFPVNFLDCASQVAFGIFFCLFPDGRFVPRWTIMVAVASAPFFIVDIFFFPEPPLRDILGLVFFAFLACLIAAQVYRYRAVSTPEQRRQTRFVVFGFSVALVGFSAIVLSTEAFESSGGVTGPFAVMVFVTLLYAFLALIPLSIGAAILYSRLYDIDVLINRTLVYGILTTSLVGMYLAGVVGLQFVMRYLTGSESQLAIVASTLAIAALFSPLRRRIQRVVDRRFYRSKYDARRTLDEFSRRLRDGDDLDVLSGDLISVVKRTVQPESVGLWIRDTGRKNDV